MPGEGRKEKGGERKSVEGNGQDGLVRIREGKGKYSAY